ncbi:C6 zinc finger transcription factor [Fusarium sp. NRRL 52700]|nr:C6 zinc finger transcription factor [Fusarium sp. NRRL 52700]
MFLAAGTSKRKANQAAKRSTTSPPSSQGSPGRAISVPTIDRALSYFILSYIDSTVYGTYLPQLYAEAVLQNPTEDALVSTIRAASMAVLAKRHRSQEALGLAFKELSTALAQTNASLACPATALLNSTLGAVLTLGLFESIVSTGRENIDSWTAHTLGTIALLRLRGLQQFRDILGRRMCIHAAYNIRVSCINRAVGVPQALVQMEEDFYEAFNFPRAVREHYSIMNKTCSIKAELKNGLTAELICRAIETDHEADLFIQGFSTSTGPVKEGLSRTSPPTDRQALVNNVMLHSATGAPPLAMMARWLFGMLMLRLVLNEIVWSGGSMYDDHPEVLRRIHQARSGLYAETSNEDHQSSLAAYAVKKISQISRKVLAFAPKLIGEEYPVPPFPKMARCMVLPLAFIQSSPCCPTDIRQETNTLLLRLKNDIELSQGQFAATVHYASRLAGEWYVLNKEV